MGIKNVIMTIIRRVADPGDYNRGLTNALKVDPVPSHQNFYKGGTKNA
jgi:glyceraldehyde-3-phosphate dehydrogenase (NAD(P))